MERKNILISLTILLMFSSCIKHYDPEPKNGYEIFQQTPPKDGTVSIQTYAPFITSDSSILMQMDAYFRHGWDTDTTTNEKIYLDDQGFHTPRRSFRVQPMFGQTLKLAFKDSSNCINFYFPQNIILSEPTATCRAEDNLMHPGSQLVWNADYENNKSIIISIEDDSLHSNQIYTNDTGEFTLTSDLFKGIKKGQSLDISIERNNYLIFKSNGEEYQIVSHIIRDFPAVYE